MRRTDGKAKRVLTKAQLLLRRMRNVAQLEQGKYI